MKQTTLILCIIGLLIVLVVIGLYMNRTSEKYGSSISQQEILPYSPHAPNSESYYSGLESAYDNNDLLNLPPIVTINATDVSVVPTESGMNIRRSGYKVGMKPQKVIGSFGVGYTDERALCETCS